MIYKILSVFVTFTGVTFLMEAGFMLASDDAHTDRYALLRMLVGLANIAAGEAMRQRA